MVEECDLDHEVEVLVINLIFLVLRPTYPIHAESV